MRVSSNLHEEGRLRDSDLRSDDIAGIKGPGVRRIVNILEKFAG